MKAINKILICAALRACTASCKKSVLDEHPPQILTADNLLVDYNGYQNALNGLYYQVRRSRGGLTTSDPNNDIMFEVNVEGVDNSYSNYPGTPGTIFNNWGAANNASVTAYSQIFSYLYTTINAANTIIGRAPANTAMTDAQKNQWPMLELQWKLIGYLPNNTYR
jgi:hypothetical protein